MTFPYTSRNPLIFDGAMQTYYQSQNYGVFPNSDTAVIYEPDLIEDIHAEYIEAGASAIKTSSFSASSLLCARKEIDANRLIDAAGTAAQKACSRFPDRNLMIFGDIGPVNDEDADHAAKIYIHQATRFLSNGIRNLLVETLPFCHGIEELAAFWKENSPEGMLIVSFAVGPDCVSRAGYYGSELLEMAGSLEGVDAVGFNCMSGPHHLLNVIQGIKPAGKPLIVMPNAGYPEIRGRKTAYKGDPEYFAYQMAQIRDQGAAILGGCCGTTPEHIRKMCGLLQKPVQTSSDPSESESDFCRPLPPNPIWDKLNAGIKIAAVELDPPASDIISPFLHGVGRLKQAGADMITIADNPIGRPRADSSLLACKIKREIGIDVLPHMTCRDRNLNAAKSLLLGLSIEGIHNLLLITGDPIPNEFRDEVKSVFSFNSRRLASYISNMPSSVLSVPFRMFGALNINARNFDVQIRLAKEKEACGIQGFLTQPVLSKQGLENLKRAHQELNGKILGGILPLVSKRNALFLQNEISGMSIDPKVVELFEGKEREEAQEIGIRISLEAAKAMKEYVDGYYIMTPFNRTAMIASLLEQMRNEGLLPSAGNSKPI